jgi:cell division septation protein DedD
MANEPEITVSTGKMVGLFVALVVVCALFFGFGYSMGKSAAVSASARPAPAIVVTGQRAPIPASARTTPAAASTVVPGTPSANPNGAYVLQIAAVTRQEDAEALVAALRKKEYSVFAVNNAPSDKLFHVQIGPFDSPKDAETLRVKLIGDGYNPIVKKQG